MALRLNNSDNYESIKIVLSKEKTPIAFENRVLGLIDSGLSREEAEIEATTELEVEMYYDPNAGLFLVEAEAVESGTIYNPYSSELLDDADDC